MSNFFAFFFFFLFHLTSAYPKTAVEYQDQIKQAIDEYSDFYSIGFNFAVVHDSLNFTYAAGPNHGKTPLTTDDKVPLGSFTKTFTTMTIMKYVEDGKMSLNDTIGSRCDEWLKKTNGSSLVEILQGDETINHVTLYQLLSMTSGLVDYDDNWAYI